MPRSPGGGTFIPSTRRERPPMLPPAKHSTRGFPTSGPFSTSSTSKRTQVRIASPSAPSSCARARPSNTSSARAVSSRMPSERTVVALAGGAATAASSGSSSPGSRGGRRSVEGMAAHENSRPVFRGVCHISRMRRGPMLEVMRSPRSALVVLLVFLALPARAALLELVTEDVAGPIYLTHAGDSRLFMVERDGAVRVFQGGAVLPTPFLDISSRVDGSGEGGLLSIAFDPDYASNGAFYVSYTTDDPVDGFTSIVSRFHVSSGDPNVADPAEDVLLRLPQPFTNHHGRTQ